MQYEPIDTIIKASGLRIVLLQGFPSPWGQAAKMMMDYKGLDYRVGPQEAGGGNPELVAWSGTNSGPVVALDDQAPLNRWNDILFLLERLAPDKSLVPADGTERALMFGLSHELCGELGFGWNRRLDMFRPAMEADDTPPPIVSMAAKWGYNATDVAAANGRAIATLKALGSQLRAQRNKGCEFLVGDNLTALDFYWTAFSNMVDLMAPEVCPLDDAVRPMFANPTPEVAAALDPILIEHRDHIMQNHCKIPMEL